MLFGTIESGSVARIDVESIAFSKKKVELAVDEIVYLTTSILPKESQNYANLSWEYDRSILYVESADNTGMTIKGLSSGQTALKVTAGNFSDTCVITVTGQKDLTSETPYIYSSFSFCEIPIGTNSKINVSLYNGTIGDVNDFTWSIEDPAIASISASGQYCVINANVEGFTRIKVSHPKATYQYYINVLTYGDNTKTPYIHTEQDVVTLNLSSGTKTLEVSIKNPADTVNNTEFKWDIINAESENPFSISPSGNSVSITPIRSGSAYIQVSYPSCAYPLSILVRVVTIVQNVYIEPSVSQLTVTGEETKSITALLKGTTDNLNVEQFVWTVDDESIIEYYANADQFSVTPKKNGSTYVTVTHPAAEFARRVLVVCKGLLTDAIDASCYITTSQNYVRTKVGNTTTTLNISLKGGRAGDEKSFTWNVKSTAKDGSTDKVIDFTTEHGSVIFSRKAISSSAYGKGIITPLKPGIAVITLSHPQSYYTTEVLVVVLEENAIIEEPFLLTTSVPVISMIYGEEKTLSLSLKGNNVLPSEESKIVWSTSCPSLAITANGSYATIKSLSSEYTTAIVTAAHPNAIDPLSFVVIMAATQEELDVKKALYSFTSNFRIPLNSEIDLSIYGLNFEATDYDNITWSVNNANCSVIRSESLFTSAVVKGLSLGTSIVTAQCPGSVPYSFTITILPDNVPTGYLGAPVYLTTTQNVNVLNIGSSIPVNVTLLNAPSEEYQNIVWFVDNPSIVSITPSGNTATITGISDGECVITVSHPLSANLLKLNCKVGTEYVYVATPEDIYVSVNTDVISLVKGGESFLLQSYLVNNESISGFDFVSNKDIVSLTKFDDGRCFIKPVEAGQCIITVSHTTTRFSKDVLVLIANTEEELKGFSYLKPSQKVITIGTGSNKPVSVSAVNTDSPIEGYVWASSNRAIADVASSGSTAILYANSVGTVKISITHPSITYATEIICVVVDSSLIDNNPYISVNPKLLTITKSTTWSSINAELVGSKNESDLSNFTWTCADSSIAQLVSEGSVAKIRGLNVGITTATVSHPNAKFPEQLTIVVDNYKDSTCTIDIKESIIDLKPTDGAKTITANLINGLAEDKYSFKWSLDVYDVVDLKYSNNVASITPLNQGECTINVTHPKAAFNQQIIVRVSEYKNFGFGVTNKTVSEGKTAFISMQVPASSVSQHIVYISDNAKVCSIVGTNQVCQITGIAPGTTKVKAQLVATATNTVKAEAELLVSIEKSDNALVYITAPQNIYTIEKGSNKTLSATLTGQGVIPTDQNNLKWKSSNPAIVTIRGVSTTGFATGSSAFIEAVNPGEAIITVSHEKSNSDFTFMIIVPGSKEQNIVLNKTYVNLQKSLSTEVTAKINNASITDYKNIIWEVGNYEGKQICRIMGSGQTVGLFAIDVGNCILTASLPNGNKATCEINIENTRHFTFEYDSVVLKPGEKKLVNFSVAPKDSELKCFIGQEGVFSYKIAGTVLELVGLAEGSTDIQVITTNYNCKDTLFVQCRWDYKLGLSTNKIAGKPDQPYVLTYEVEPPFAVLQFEKDEKNPIAPYDITVNSINKTITITPTGEIKDTITVKAKNPQSGTEFASKTISLNMSWGDTLTPYIALKSKDGLFSYYDGIIHLGDGEIANLTVQMSEPRADFEITNFTVRNNSSYADLICTSVSAGPKIKNAEVCLNARSRSVINTEYLIPTWYDPVTPVLYKDDGSGKGNYIKATDPVALDPTRMIPLKISDFHPMDKYSDFGWDARAQIGYDYYYLDTIHSNTYTQFLYIIGSGKVQGNLTSVIWPWRTINTSKSNTRLSKADYEKNPFYVSQSTISGTYSTWVGGAQTGNQPATLVADDDQTLLSSSQDYTLIIWYNHMGVYKTAEIPIYIETRNCNKNVSQLLSDDM